MATLVAIPASIIPRTHTVLSAFAFIAALALGWLAGLWEQLCKNAVAGWPVEWWPSVSATIGDHAPARSPFQLLIALTATPRFIFLALQWIAHRYPPRRRGASEQADSSDASGPPPTSQSNMTKLPKMVKDGQINGTEGDAPEVINVSSTSFVDAEIVFGIARTFCCGGWVYVTSRDQHDVHDLFMIVYIILDIPWMVLSTINSTSGRARRWRVIAGSGFLLSIPILVWLYYRHSVLRIPGAYTLYSFLEWSLVIWDVAFDAATAVEIDHLQLNIVDLSRKEGPSLKDELNVVFIAPPATNSVPNKYEDWTSIIPDPPHLPYRAALAWISDIWFAVVFWTVFTSLSVQLFYWSVWKLALSGSELALLANLAPYAMAIRPYREFTTSRAGLFVHRFLTVVAGLGCYVLPSVAGRLCGVILGTWAGWCTLLGDSIRLQGSLEMITGAKILVTGLVTTLILKYNAYSTNPLWPIADSGSGGWNKTGLAISALSLLEYYHRPANLFPAPLLQGNEGSSGTSHQGSSNSGVVEADLSRITHIKKWAISLGFGALVHLVQTFVTDSGTIIAWSWTGYPVTGPTLHPYAGLVTAVAMLAVVGDIDATSPVWSLMGCAAAIGLYAFPDWVGFASGLMLVFYVVSVFPLYFRAIAACHPVALGHAMLFNCVLDVASVFTVAYAFVPLGWLLRERTDIVLAVSMITIVIGASVARSIEFPDQSRLQLRSVKRTRKIKAWTLWAAGLLATVALISSYLRLSPNVSSSPTPYYPNHLIFTGGIWTVHFGIDEAGRDSQRRMADLVREMEVDVLGLLETDLHRFVYGNRDLTRYIAEELGYYVDIGPGPNKHTWGAALLSKFPILNSTHHLLPSPHGELAPAIHATLDIHGQHVNVLVSHNGQEEDPLDRELQTRELARLLSTTVDTPTVFLGYLVTHLKDRAPAPYQILFEDGQIHDIEIEDRWRWCEYIGFRGLWRVAFGRLEHSDVTDTELQVGKFLLPIPGTVATYNSNEETYWHIGEDDIPEPWRMPQKFRGKGIRGHAYRVWEGPVYYLPPEHSGMREYGWGWSTAIPVTPDVSEDAEGA